MKNRIVSIFIIFFILISYIFPIISFGNSYNYVALGDSIPLGFALSNPNEDNYAEKFRQKYNISSDNFENLSISSETTEDFFYTIQTSEYTDSISNADILTITIGANEITEIVMEAVSVATGLDMETPNFPEEAANLFLEAELSDKLDMLLALYNYCTTEDIQGKIDTQIARYEEYWKKSIEYIKQINPNVTIAVTEFYNPYYEVTLGNYDFGGFVDEIMQRMNTILTNYSNSETEYKIAKIYSTFNTTNPRLTNVNLSLSNFNIDPHPTVVGHEIISLKILEALSTTNNSQDKKDISELSISSLADHQYTGESLEPSIVVKDGNSTLVEGEDYIVIYYNNINIGEATAIIAGIGNYTGKVTKTFNIYNANRKEISDCQIEALDAQFYLGMNIEPDLVIKDGSTTLQRDKDYTLKYTDNMNAGKATITITGIGNYTGISTTSFTILPQSATLTLIQDIPDQLYTGEEITPNVIVSFGSAKLIEGTDYTLEYENNIDEGTATVNIKGIGNFTGSVAKEFNISSSPSSELQDISEAIVSEIPDKTYTGSSITPAISIAIGAQTLTLNVDYMTFYSNNIDVGTGVITIVGMGEYTGTIEKKFKISPKEIENLSLADISDQIYTGTTLQPEITLTDNAKILKKDTDYTVKYSNNTEIGTATVQINGKGNYTGSITKTFNIVEKAIENTNGNNQNTNQNSSDKTTANTILPFAGAKLLLFVALLISTVMATVSYILYKKYFSI